MDLLWWILAIFYNLFLLFLAIICCFFKLQLLNRTISIVILQQIKAEAEKVFFLNISKDFVLWPPLTWFSLALKLHPHLCRYLENVCISKCSLAFNYAKDAYWATINSIEFGFGISITFSKTAHHSIQANELTVGHDICKNIEFSL